MQGCRRFENSAIRIADQLIQRTKLDRRLMEWLMPLRELRKTRIGPKVKMGGLIADGVRRPPTAKGTAFIRLEEPEGMMEVIIPAEVYLKSREALRSGFVVVEGRGC